MGSVVLLLLLLLVVVVVFAVVVVVFISFVFVSCISGLAKLAISSLRTTVT